MTVMNELFAVLAVSLVVAAYAPYVIKIAKGSVKPHPFTWLIFTIAESSVFALQTSQGSGGGAYATATTALFALTIFILSMRQGIPSIKLLDIVCLITAVLGVGIWLIVQEPVASIVILLSVGLIGFTPTVIKGFKKPYEDSVTMWSVNSLRHTMSLLAIEQYNIVTILNPISWATIGFGFSALLLIRRIPAKKPKNRKRNFRPYI